MIRKKCGCQYVGFVEYNVDRFLSNHVFFLNSDPGKYIYIYIYMHEMDGIYLNVNLALLSSS